MCFDGAPGGRTLEFFQLLVEVCVEVALNNAGMRLLKLVLIEIHKNGPDIVY